MVTSIRIDAKDLHYTPLNQKIRAAIADGVKEIIIDNVLGSGLLATGSVGMMLLSHSMGVPGGDLPCS